MAITDIKTVVGLFDDINDARNSVQELTNAGFPQADINLIAHASAEEYGRYFDANGKYVAPSGEEVVYVNDETANAAGGASVGAGLGALAGLVLGLSFLTFPAFGPILVSGSLAGALLGAGVGGVLGSLAGSLTETGMPVIEAHTYAEGVRRGGTLVTVRATEATAPDAAAILNRNRPIDVTQRAATWRERGWHEFDPKAPAYTTAQIAEERRLYAATPATVVTPAVPPTVVRTY